MYGSFARSLETRRVRITSSTGKESTVVPQTPDPTWDNVESYLKGLVTGNVSREDASSWALRAMRATENQEFHPALWDALDDLMGADAISIDRPYLYEQEDFEAWLAALRAARP
jgi:hypothetical protein